MKNLDLSSLEEVDEDVTTEEMPKSNKQSPLSSEVNRQIGRLGSKEKKLDLNALEDVEEQEPEDSSSKSILRSLLQVPLGAAQAVTFPADIFKVLAQSQALSDLPDLLEDIPPEKQEEFKKNFLEGINEVSSYFPTQSGAEEFIEKKTGAPLVPKNKLQKLIRLGATTATMTPGGAISKIGAGITAPAVSSGAQALGAPESISDIAGMVAGGGAVSLAKRALNPTNKANELVSNIVKDGLPINARTEYENALKKLQEIPSPRIPKPTSLENSPLGESRKVTQETGGMSLRPVATHPVQLEHKINRIFTDHEPFVNLSEHGVANVGLIRTNDQKVYQGVRELYQRSDILNSKFASSHQELVSNLNDRISQLSAIPHRSDVQNRLLKAQIDVRDALCAVDEFGHITGYKQINNNILLQQATALRDLAKYDFAHGEAKNAFRPVIQEIQESAMNAARQSGNLEAVAANVEARSAYKDWATVFDNDYVRPFRDISNQDYNKLMKSLENPDNANQIWHALQLTEEGKALAKQNNAFVVNKKMSKFMQNPKKINTPEFEEALDDLRAYKGITAQDIATIRSDITNAAKSPNFKAVSQGPTQDQSIAAKYLNKKPEDVPRMLDTASGIKQLREELAIKDPTNDSFDVITRQKMRSMLKNGKLEKNFTGKDLENFFNDEYNNEIFSEIIGPDKVEEMRLYAKEIGAKEVAHEAKYGFIKNIDAATAIKFLIKMM